MSDHYKLLISDEEVIKALLKDSKSREGKLPTEVTRIKPNINFFQRTVNSLVSTNTRIDKSVDTFKSQHIKERTERNKADFRISPTHRKVRPKVNYSEERKLVLDNKIKFVKSAERLSIKNVNFSGTDVPMKTNTIRTDKSREPFNSAVLQHGSSIATKDSDLFDSKNSLTCSYLILILRFDMHAR
ncbi:uncharacterized protein LOC115876072 isoform X2 [Sitophilus oryzae]|uniref:Uncharacterized protein LOC115876072 isoform X2 n=1 Tax=Sitophilus oryzae TaxID=7048 RepID=A0A6J2X8Q7_SITOR|nr:uncharacterized protein LOC115876072 isoform X2 [Sitophilus oryzae]